VKNRLHACTSFFRLVSPDVRAGSSADGHWRADPYLVSVRLRTPPLPSLCVPVIRRKLYDGRLSGATGDGVSFSGKAVLSFRPLSNARTHRLGAVSSRSRWHALCL
jgi:hypothetical protein